MPWRWRVLNESRSHLLLFFPKVLEDFDPDIYLYQEQNEAPQIMGGPPVAFLLRKQTAKCNPDAEGVVAGRQGRESDLLQGEVQGSLAALLKTTGYGFGFRVHGPELKYLVLCGFHTHPVRPCVQMLKFDIPGTSTS